MKIIIPSPIEPTKKNRLIQYVYNLKKGIEKNQKCELIWIVAQPDKFENYKFHNDHVIDIRNFKNASHAIRKINPDIVLANNNSREPLSFSFSLAAKKEKIPLVFYYLNDLSPVFGKGPYKSYKENISILLRNFFSDKVVTDEDSQKRKFRRGKFFLFKNSFLMKTRLSLGINLFSVLYAFFSDLSLYIFYKKPIWTKLGDLNLCSNQELFNFWLKDVGINEKKIVITGSPFWDEIYWKLKEINEKKERGKIRVLLTTAALVEHGLWSIQDRENYLTNIFNQFKNMENIVLDLKIHPASESKIFYERFLEINKFNAKIFQKEDFLDIIKDYDIVLSYHNSTIHTICAYGGIKTVFLESDSNYTRFSLVDEAIDSEYFMICNNFEKIVPTILKLNQKEVKFNQKIINAREKMSFKFDGKSGDRAASAIIKLIEK